jgi:hypothetical protein
VNVGRGIARARQAWSALRPLLRAGYRRPSPAISIVVPVFAAEAHLTGCLESLLGQSFGDIEIIIVDDGSPRDVPAVVARTAGRDPRVSVIRHERNEGTLAARLTGAASARGTYLGFVDADDVVEDTFVAVLLDAARMHDADLVQCAISWCQPDGACQPFNRGGDQHALQGSSVLTELLAGGMSNSVANKIVRRQVWKVATQGLSPMRLLFGEDLLLLFLVACASQRYAHISDALYRYMIRNGSTTTVTGPEACLGRLKDLGMVYRTILPELRVRPQAEALKVEFYQREFLDVAGALAAGAGRHLAPGPHAWAEGFPALATDSTPPSSDVAGDAPTGGAVRLN